MRDYLVAQRYASGLAAAMPDTERLERALGQITTLGDMLAEYHDFRSCIGNDTIDEEVRWKVLSDVLERMHAEKEVVRLARLLLARDRTFSLSDIAEIVSTIVDERLNRTTAVVTTAVELTDGQRQRIEEGLAQFSGKAVRLKCSVAPELVGGVHARIGGSVIDGSLRTQLQKLKNELIAEEI